MHLVDVIALMRITANGAGIYRALYIIPNGDPLPEAHDTDHKWIRLVKCISPDEANAILQQYPQAAKPRW